MKPLLVYVDDEPNNLAVFEAVMPEDWEIKTYSEPMQALAQLDKIKPSVILSDQRMPGMTGVQFLEIAKKIHPSSLRIIVTGQSDEDLVVDSVRKAQIFDYIRKPWDVEQLKNSIQKALDFFEASEQSKRLMQQLQDQTEMLKELAKKAQDALLSEEKTRKELESWVPPIVLWSLRHPEFQFPLKTDLFGITFDIIESSQWHEVSFQNVSLRSRVLQLYSEAIIRHGGWRESTSGDSAYAHFGLALGDNASQEPPAEAAFAAAKEFKAALEGLCETSGFQVRCGISLHFARNCIVDVHITQLMTHRGAIVQKAFETISSEIDLLHRAEKIVHSLPGTNIILTKAFLEKLKNKPEHLFCVGSYLLKGQKNPVEFYLMKSEFWSEEQIRQKIAEELAA